MERNGRRVPLLRLAPEIWKYQAFTKLALMALLAAIRACALFTLRRTTGREPAGADYRLLLHTWQGWLTIIFALIVLAVWVSVDLNVKVLCAGNALDGSAESLFATLKKAFAALPKFLNVYGLGVVLYVTLIPPAAGAGALLFLSGGLAISNQKTPPQYYAAYAAFALAFVAAGASRVFCLHGVLLDGLSVWDSRRRSAALIRTHWRHFLGQNVVCGLAAFAFAVLAGTFFFILPLSLGAQFLPNLCDATTARSLMILLLFLNAAMVGAFALLAAPLYFVRMTQLYREYLAGAPVEIPSRVAEKHPLLAALAALYVLEIAALSSQTARNFDAFFPPLTAAQIVAHRGGGSENAENTLSGLWTAVALGAYGSEIDVQRTLDGYYVINHDSTFERVAGDARTLWEMTLEEIKAIRYPVPTLEEMLDAAKGRIVLFIELKGDTANRKMCDDVVKMIRERGMAGETVLLSFKLNLIEYIERRWPEMRTGYLIFSYDEAASLPCDYVGIEETFATPAAIDAAHRQGKKALVWTPNNPDAQERFLVAKADAIITDNVSGAYEVLNCLNRGDDLGRITSALRP